ncbi:MAG: class I SAM-dependent methyltransferase [Verrucomicrobiota bacterium]
MQPASTDTAQSCDLCGSPQYHIFARQGRHGSRLNTVICEGCGLVYTNPRLSEKENESFYHDDYWGAYKNQSMPDEKFFRRRVPKIKPLLKQLQPLLQPGMAILEVGCSVGALLSHLKTSLDGQGTFIGIEPHRGHAQFARERKGLDVRSGLLHEIAPDLPKEGFDLVVMNHVLEHTTSPTDVLETLRGLLKPGGLFVVEVPNIEAPGSRLSHFFHVAHHYCFSPNTLKRLALKTGFAVRELAALDGDLPGTRLNAVLQKAAAPDPAAATLRDDPAARSLALRKYERWYWLTAASLRKKITHWKRQRA